jgi:predicted O-methyltransferase YrrM
VAPEAQLSPPSRGAHDPGIRVSRFHTVRGPMPLTAWLRYPAAWLRARTGRIPERPWMVPAAIGWLRRHIRSDWSVLELGAGRSTAWFARRAGAVISFEDNELWHERARQLLDQRGLHNVDLRLSPIDLLPSEVAALPDQGFDLVVVDFLEAPNVTRVDALRPALEKVKPGRYLLLDDSDRTSYAEAFELLDGWRVRRFSGMKDEWHEACETSIFTRPK